MGHLGAVCWQPASLLGFVGPSLGHLRVACWQAGSISAGCQHTALTCSKLSPTRPQRPVANIQPEDAPSLLRPHKICRLPTYNPKMLQARSNRLQKTCGLPTYGAQQAQRNMYVVSIQSPRCIKLGPTGPIRPAGCQDTASRCPQLSPIPKKPCRLPTCPKRPAGCAHTGPNKPHKTRRNM